MKITMLLRFLLLCIPFTNALTLNCEFKTNNWSTGSVYYCNLNYHQPITTSDISITNILGNHITGKRNNNVEGFHAASTSGTFNYIPKNLGTLFPFINSIVIWNGRVKEIHQNDLKQFPYLRDLNMRDNDITYLEMDLFMFNSNLEFIRLEKNLINQVFATAFDNLINLHFLSLDNNECVKENAKGKFEVLQLISKVKNQCKSLEIQTSIQTLNFSLQEKAKLINALENDMDKRITDLQASKLKLKDEISTIKFNHESLQESHNLTQILICLLVFVIVIMSYIFMKKIKESKEQNDLLSVNYVNTETQESTENCQKA